MCFELDQILLDEILFYMENQDSDFLIDTQKGQIIDVFNNSYDEEPDFKDNKLFISLPEWSSSEGFRLMEKFTAGLKNPVIRQELSAALNRNKGVFRAFRNVLLQYPETEKLWFNYKEKEMKREIIAWYNMLREEWGLEPVGGEPEDNLSLVLEDFNIKEGKNDYMFIAETADGDYAGCIEADINNSLLYISKLEVNPEYRGMGIGKTLLVKLLEKADKQNLDLSIDLPAEAQFFSRSLLLENFKPCMQRFIRKK
jgi:ribosomal protein S18 acetylase RimI-like enzyme